MIKGTRPSQATYYRWLKQYKCQKMYGLNLKSKRPITFKKSKDYSEITKKIIEIRKENLTYGKSKIHTILCRDYDLQISQSTVGRIMSRLMKKGTIKRYQSHHTAKRKRNFNHAKRWKYGMKGAKPGELIPNRSHERF